MNVGQATRGGRMKAKLPLAKHQWLSLCKREERKENKGIDAVINTSYPELQLKSSQIGLKISEKTWN